MSESYRALCTDFYVNHKLTVKMELPRTRETILDMFERVRRQYPSMAGFRRYRDELALESPQTDMPHRWLAIRNNNMRTGTVNPPTLEEGYSLHRHVLEVAPSYLSISPLDVDFIELLYGFDLSAQGNHDAIVLDSVLQGSPFANLIDIPGTTLTECQPTVGMSLGDGKDETEVYFEVKTRPANNPARDPEQGDPISVYVTLRKFGPVSDVKELPAILSRLAAIGQELVETRVVPGLLVPIREAIGSGNA
jgi:hypothetical protein